MMDIVERLGRIASSLDEIEREDMQEGIAEITRLRAEVDRLREAVIGLFSALDDCDTADDIAKSDDAAFRRLVRKAHAKRWGYATTDGYTVTPLHHPRQDAEKE